MKKVQDLNNKVTCLKTIISNLAKRFKNKDENLRKENEVVDYNQSEVLEKKKSVTLK